MIYNNAVLVAVVVVVLKLPITERLSPDLGLLGSYLNVQFKGHWSDVGVKVEQACSTNSQPLGNVLVNIRKEMIKNNSNVCRQSLVD